MKTTSLNPKTSLFIILTVLAVCIIWGSFYTVETGQQAAVSRFGKFVNVTGEGLHFKIPFIDSADIITVRNTSYGFNDLEVSTKDMQSIFLNMVVQITVTDLDTLYRKYRNNYKISFIDPRVREIIQANISRYTIEEFVSKRQELSMKVFEAIKADMADDGLNVTNVSIVNHDFSDNYEEAVENKKIAEQRVETAKFEQEKARVEAQNRVELAKFKLEEKKLQAEANKVEAQSLSTELLQKMQLEKWDGVLPHVISGKENGLMLNLNNK